MSTNQKILVRLSLPACGLAHDVRLPVDLRIRDVTPTLAAMMRKMHERELALSPTPLLCRSDSGEPLAKLDATLEECGVRDADTLYFV